MSHPQPIFVVGLMPRSGSHFLASLLCQHPACTKSVLAEDLVLPHADLLAKFVAQNVAGWSQTMGPDNPGDPDLLYRCLGESLLSFMQRTRERYDRARSEQFNAAISPAAQEARLVAKTPNIRHVDHFFRLFPEAHLLLLVRDGRAVVESCARSFGKDRVKMIHKWAKNARELLSFLQSPKHAGRAYRLVRYEDLHRDTEGQMREILPFLGLDASCYDFEAARNLPVIGSSTFKRGEGKVSWLPVRKAAEFDPLSRAADWDDALLKQFQTIAGAELAQLGYE